MFSIGQSSGRTDGGTSARVFGTYAIHNLMRLLSKVKPIEFCLVWLGDRSEFLYLTHLIFMYAVHMIFFRSDFSILGKWACPVYALLTVTLFVLACILVEFAIGAIRKRKQGKEQAA